jgi:hypothetical protein
VQRFYPAGTPATVGTYTGVLTISKTGYDDGTLTITIKVVDDEPTIVVSGDTQDTILVGSTNDLV